MKNVNVAAVQFTKESVRGTKNAARIMLKDTRDVLDSLRGYGLDLVVFSEGVGSVGQTPETAEAVDDPGPFLKTYCNWAAEERCHVAGSIMLREDGRVCNSTAFIGPSGTVLGVYRKANLTDGEIEAGIITGDGAVVVDTAIGRLGGIICFDLNFEWLRHQYRALKPDILTFGSLYHGGLAQHIWAYDCRSFFVGACQFFGSGILDPFGRTVKATDCYTSVARATINLDRVMVHMDYNRDKLPEIEKKYRGSVVIDVPANIGSALIYSTSESMSAMDVVREFDLKLLDDYFAEAAESNARNRRPGRAAGKRV